MSSEPLDPAALGETGSSGGVAPLLEALSSQIVVVDGQGRIEAANNAWRERSPIQDYFAAFQMVARPDLELLAAVREGIDGVLRGEQPEFVIEYPLREAGERRWMLLRAAPVRSGAEPRALIAHVDVTARRQAERLSGIQHEILTLVVADTPLRATLERLAAAVELEAPGGTFVAVLRAIDPGTLSVGAGPELAPGIADQIDGAPQSHLGHLIDGPTTVDLDRFPPVPWAASALAHGYRTVAVSPIRSPNGSELGVVLLLFRAGGAPPASARGLMEVAASLAAIAVERHRTARALREREARLQSVFTLQPDAVLTLDAEGRIQTVNPAAEHLLGETGSDLLRCPLIDLVPANLRTVFQEHLERALRGYPQRFTVAIHPRGRARLDVDATLVPLLGGGAGDSSGNGVYVVAKNITDQLAAAERLERSGKQLRQSAKMEAVGRLAGGIAHDFNNLLTAIRGYTDILLSEGGPTDASSREDLVEIARAVERASSLTRQLLTFSRQQVVTPKLVDLNGVVEECRSMLARLLRADTKLVLHAHPEPLWVRADPIQIHQVIINLVVNAQDAMPNGGRLTLETARFEVGREGREPLVPLNRGSYVTLTVTDTGRGMDSEVQTHIFEPFFTTKPPGQGTGLGLSTVYGIVEQSGGRIGFRSALDQGTSFVIYLPAQETGADRDEGAPVERRVPAGVETVLVVEDEESVRSMVRKILATAGYTVLEARHGADGLLVSREFPGHIDLVLTDVVMPELNGLRLAEILRRERPDTAVIFMSGYTRDEVDRRGVSESGLAFIHKPFTVTELATIVRQVLDGNRQRAPSS